MVQEAEVEEETDALDEALEEALKEPEAPRPVREAPQKARQWFGWRPGPDLSCAGLVRAPRNAETKDTGWLQSKEGQQMRRAREGLPAFKATWPTRLPASPGEG